MNEELFLNLNDVKGASINDEDITTEEELRIQEVADDSTKGKKRGLKAAGIVGAVGLAGLALNEILTPSTFFPEQTDVEEFDVDEPEIVDAEMNDSEMNDVELVDSDNENFEPAPEPTPQIQGHDMSVATGVNDSMSFGRAFATARREVGPGGLFVWRGHTYGTYYKNEWESMSADERDQYWADVYHTTSHVAEESQPEDDVMHLEVQEGDDGQSETLILDPVSDEEKQLVIDEDDVSRINGVVITPDEKSEPVEEESIEDMEEVELEGLEPEPTGDLNMEDDF